MASYKGTTLRAFRVNDELYAAAKQEAAKRGDSLSDIVRNALKAYITQPTTERAEAK